MILPTLQIRAASLTLDQQDLPDGVCGRVSGIALRYDVVDSYGTVFRRGCLDKTKQKVAAKRVKLFVNHGAGDSYGTSSHVGTVRSLTPMGDGELMVADLFDTTAGRAQKEYLMAVMASGGETGLSIGFYERMGAWETVDGVQTYAFSEVELDEISLAPRQAVPGADVLGVRHSSPISVETATALLRQIKSVMSLEQIRLLLEATAGDDESHSAAPAKSDDESSSDVVLSSYADRIAAVRRSLINSRG